MQIRVNLKFILELAFFLSPLKQYMAFIFLNQITFLDWLFKILTSLLDCKSEIDVWSIYEWEEKWQDA